MVDEAEVVDEVEVVDAVAAAAGPGAPNDRAT